MVVKKIWLMITCTDDPDTFDWLFMVRKKSGCEINQLTLYDYLYFSVLTINFYLPNWWKLRLRSWRYGTRDRETSFFVGLYQDRVRTSYWGIIRKKKLPLYLFNSLIHSLFTGIRNKRNEFKIHTRQVPRTGDQIDICWLPIVNNT